MGICIIYGETPVPSKDKYVNGIGVYTREYTGQEKGDEWYMQELKSICIIRHGHVAQATGEHHGCSR